MSEAERANLFQRTLGNLRNALQGVTGNVFGFDPDNLKPDLPDGELELVRAQMRDCLEARGGEVSARARAATLGRAYLSLSAKGRQRFLNVLAHDFATDLAAVDDAVEVLHRATDDDTRSSAVRALRDALDPPRRKLLTQFNAIPEGVKFLVDLRAELLPLARKDPDLRDLDRDLRDLLAAWFDIGFLDLERITWETPAAVLEKLILYEAVHEIKDWDDLKNRLDSDRRCFAFFHPRMPDEPLIFVEVALTDGIADNIQTLLDETAPVEDPVSADTAIFYSISNAQRGLDGIGFGGFLIKRVADLLAEEFPKLKNFSTLSPIPGFRRWLQAQMESGEELLTAAERKAIGDAAENGDHPLQVLLSRPNWHRAKEARGLAKPMMRLCAQYLLEAKRPDGKALDPVANFHLSNGARIERLNWLADISKNGLEQSYGIMVNYLYRLDDIPENHERYSGDGRIATSSTMRAMAKG